VTTKLKEPPTNSAAPAPIATTLDQRVTKTLSAPDVDHLPSSTFSATVAEVNAAVDDLDWRARAARQRALDPTLDGIAERSRAEDLEFQSSRLTAGRARLLEYGKTALARERLVAWHARADQIEPTRDALAAELVDKYPRIAAELADLLTRVSVCDREAAQIDAGHPGMESRRIGNIQSAVQKLTGAPSSVKLAEQVKLPALDGKGAVWPPAAAAHPFQHTNLMSRSERRALGMAD
jgi:hypothetical protein